MTKNLSTAELVQISGGRGKKVIYQAPLANGNFINCEPGSGGTLTCGEFKQGVATPVQTFQFKKYLIKK